MTFTLIIVSGPLPNMGCVHRMVNLTIFHEIMIFDFEIIFENSCSAQLRDIQCQRYSFHSCFSDSHQQGWRLMSIVMAYFDCTDILKPYLFKYLEQTAYDNQLPNQAVAAQCLQNVRTTFRFGGRKNVPSRVEIEALTVSNKTD